MENRELINGILDLTAENERLKQELARYRLVVEPQTSEPEEQPQQGIPTKRQLDLLKRITAKNLISNWSPMRETAEVVSVDDEKGNPIRYEIKVKPFDKWFDSLDASDFNNYETLTKDYTIGELKELLKSAIKELYNKFVQDRTKELQRDVRDKNEDLGVN